MKYWSCGSPILLAEASRWAPPGTSATAVNVTAQACTIRKTINRTFGALS